MRTVHDTRILFGCMLRRGLRKRFTTRAGAVDAARGIDLHVSPGEIFGFLGPMASPPGCATSARPAAWTAPPRAPVGGDPRCGRPPRPSAGRRHSRTRGRRQPRGCSRRAVVPTVGWADRTPRYGRRGGTMTMRTGRISAPVPRRHVSPERGPRHCRMPPPHIPRRPIACWFAIRGGRSAVRSRDRSFA